MKCWAGLVAVALVLAGARASDAAVRIADDPGGRIGKYVSKYQRMRASGQTVIIDGRCASACTIVLSTIPPDKICITSQANFVFHAAWDFGPHGQVVTNPEATRMLYSMYPASVRRWIAHRGGPSNFPARKTIAGDVSLVLILTPRDHSGPLGQCTQEQCPLIQL
jgi:hypothetical protein